MLIKVCGMREPENIRAVAALGVDLMGFIFWDKSPRNVVSLPMSLDAQIKRVGVFVDEKIQHVLAKVNDYHLDFIQLHGNETCDYIDQLHRSTNAVIVKAISVREEADVNRWREYEGHADMLLFDTKCDCVGGSGNQFDWSVLERYDGNLPFLLSGGIGPNDTTRIKAFHHPMCRGIDLNSKFEDAPALKNIDKLGNFIKSVRNE